MVFKQKIGSRAQVMHGTAKMTGGGLKKKDLKYNKHGKIVSKKLSAIAKREKRLEKAGYTTIEGQFGAMQIGGAGEGKRKRGHNNTNNTNIRKQKLFLSPLPEAQEKPTNILKRLGPPVTHGAIVISTNLHAPNKNDIIGNFVRNSGKLNNNPDFVRRLFNEWPTITELIEKLKQELSSKPRDILVIDFANLVGYYFDKTKKNFGVFQSLERKEKCEFLIQYLNYYLFHKLNCKNKSVVIVYSGYYSKYFYPTSNANKFSDVLYNNYPKENTHLYHVYLYTYTAFRQSKTAEVIKEIDDLIVAKIAYELKIDGREVILRTNDRYRWINQYNKSLDNNIRPHYPVVSEILTPISKRFDNV